ncbi:MAG: hypothetical protein HFE44_17150 [Oscillospiraceae bacterium]|nr:hypothetical protein [Oscillospiraceae bacterium]
MELLCRLLKASRSGYYEWLHRKPSAHEQQDQAPSNANCWHCISVIRHWGSTACIT